MPAIDNIIIAKDALTAGLVLLKPLNSLIFSTYLSDFFSDNKAFLHLKGFHSS